MGNVYNILSALRTRMSDREQQQRQQEQRDREARAEYGKYYWIYNVNIEVKLK